MHIIINIKGRDWKFSLLPDKKFDKLHGEENVAMTIPDSLEVHFKKSVWDAKTIKHELLHVIFAMSLVGSTDLSPTDVEEICAEIVGEHCEEIILWSSKITHHFLRGK